ncbi:hypothetical protein [Paenibacillus sinopodophylli]|uniref:hypothetical protein n=1 Tax=Paenibacillus sinopodophylli TaxID=1837342 RepID=UPI00110D18F7|nr:hypothetical protein [Paenibacillus sinopodophylli]
MPGYISLHRDIQKHWLYQEDRVFSKYEAWIDILMRVNHSEGKVTHNGSLETVQRGSTIWSMGDMERHWKWSNRKVKRFLDCLVSDQMLAYKSTTKKTYLSVINYDVYQLTEGAKAPPMHQQSITEAFQKHTNNNDNNKEELKHIVDSNECDSSFETFWGVYPKKDGKAPCLKKWQTYWKAKKINPEEVMAGFQRYKSFVEHERNVRKFDRAWLSPLTFLNQRQWESEWEISNVAIFKLKEGDAPVRKYEEVIAEENKRSEQLVEEMRRDMF